VVITDLPGELKAYWTGMFVRQADKSRFHGVGIIPDILVETTLDDIVRGRDPVLEKALELLREEN
jgi:C-terminal processing protease CtpA/Prc